MSSIDVTVTGVPETVDALEVVQGFDVIAANRRAGEAILDTVKRNSRVSSGNLQSAWGMEEGSFVNNASYSPYQEFGTVYVTPTNALGKAWESEESDIEAAYEKELNDAIRKAGFNS